MSPLRQHYGALLRQEAGRYLVQDPILGPDVWMTKAALEHESSGYFLVPDGPLPTGWSSVANEEAATVWGKGETESSDPDATTPDDKTPCPDPAAQPMAAYTFHLMLVSLKIVDTPVRYRPPIGSPVRFKVSYNQREANQPATFAYSNLGPLWTFDWLSYIEDEPTQPNNDVKQYAQGGGAHKFPNTGAGGIFGPPVVAQTTLNRTIDSHYELYYPDGSYRVFDLADAPTNAATRRVFLTKIVIV